MQQGGDLNVHTSDTADGATVDPSKYEMITGVGLSVIRHTHGLFQL